MSNYLIDEVGFYTREEAIESLQRAGILDENGELAPQYRDDNEGEKMDLTDMFYCHQFVSNETSEINKGLKKNTLFKLGRDEVLAGTLVGSIYRENTIIQTYFTSSGGVVSFQDVGYPAIKVQSGKIDWNKGEISLSWNMPPGQCKLISSYEYKIDNDDLSRSSSKKPNLAMKDEFPKTTFEKFFNHEELVEIAMKAGTVTSWDFNTCFGDTIKEKYYSLYAKANELTSVLLKKGAKGYFWIACSPEIASVFETATYGFNPSADPYEDMPLGVQPMGLSSVTYVGSVNSKYRLYVDTDMAIEYVVIGCNDRREDSSHYGRLVIHNFLV